MPADALQQAFLFVTGASRSGTTVLSRVLGNAPDVLGLNELHFFGSLVPHDETRTPLPTEQACRAVAMVLARHERDFWVKEPTDQEWMVARRLVNTLSPDELTSDRLFAISMQEILRNADATRICEQTPRNIYYAGFLLKHFPNARIIHVMRDPRAVLASQKNRYQMRRLGGKNVPLSEIVRLWLNYHPFSMNRLWSSATRAAIALQEHPRFRIVRYEDLVTAPAATLQPLFDWLQLDYSDEVLAVPHWGSSTVTHQQSSGLSAAALDKWQSVLNGGEIAWCERRTAPERAAFDYPDSEQARNSLPGYAGMLLRLPVHVVGALLANPGRVVTQLKAMARRQT